MRQLRYAGRAMQDAKEIEAFLNEAQVGRLGLSYQDQPYIVPLNFVYLDGAFYVHCADTGMKLDYLQNNPRVCFEVDEFTHTMKGAGPCEYDTGYRSVIAFGTAEVMTDLQEKTRALGRLVAKYAGEEMAQRLTEKMVDQYKSSMGSLTAVIKITVDQMTGKQSSAE